MSTTTDFATPERREFCRDRYAEQRADAIAYLGAKWRGRADCRHEYVDSRGSRTKQEDRT
jgi:hypothetical protein